MTTIDRDAADALDAALARNNRVGNVRGRLRGLGGGECIEGSLRAVGATRRQRRAIARETECITGRTHIEVNDGARRPGDMARRMRKVSAAMHVAPSGGATSVRQAAAALAAVVALAGLSVYADVVAAVLLGVLYVLAAIAAGVLGYQLATRPHWSYAVTWARARRQQAAQITAERQAWIDTTPGGPIALDAPADRTADDALRAAWTTEETRDAQRR